MYICQSHLPDSSHLPFSPLLFIYLFSTSVSLFCCIDKIIYTNVVRFHITVGATREAAMCVNIFAFLFLTYFTLTVSRSLYFKQAVWQTVRGWTMDRLVRNLGLRNEWGERKCRRAGSVSGGIPSSELGSVVVCGCSGCLWVHLRTRSKRPVQRQTDTGTEAELEPPKRK